jgi:hypothetical protein
MCEKIIEKMPSMAAEERLQLHRNCLRAIERSADTLVVQEAKRVLAELDALERPESSFIARLPAARRIEYAFRRLPASDRDRRAIRLLYGRAGGSPQRGLGGNRRAYVASPHRRNVPQSPPPSRRRGRPANAGTAFGRSRRLGGTADRFRRGRSIRPAEARRGDGVRQSRLRRSGAAFGFERRALATDGAQRISRSAPFNRGLTFSQISESLSLVLGVPFAQTEPARISDEHGANGFRRVGFVTVAPRSAVHAGPMAPIEQGGTTCLEERRAGAARGRLTLWRDGVGSLGRWSF